MDERLRRCEEDRKQYFYNIAYRKELQELKRTNELMRAIHRFGTLQNVVKLNEIFEDKQQILNSVKSALEKERDENTKIVKQMSSKQKQLQKLKDEIESLSPMRHHDYDELLKLFQIYKQTKEELAKKCFGTINVNGELVHIKDIETLKFAIEKMKEMDLSHKIKDAQEECMKLKIELELRHQRNAEREQKIRQKQAENQKIIDQGPKIRKKLEIALHDINDLEEKIQLLKMKKADDEKIQKIKMIEIQCQASWDEYCEVKRRREKLETIAADLRQRRTIFAIDAENMSSTGSLTSSNDYLIPPCPCPTPPPPPPVYLPD